MKCGFQDPYYTTLTIIQGHPLQVFSMLLKNDDTL